MWQSMILNYYAVYKQKQKLHAVQIVKGDEQQQSYCWCLLVHSEAQFFDLSNFEKKGWEAEEMMLMMSMMLRMMK